ncbi:6-bladed beta-propeller [Mariniflexile litorale]|uniref:6-bladed beta-propeller n=1 Tax=Mariniflexile litorale TaxID=3045158 RepID=A0AAU7EHT5_9FLAO|nr:6-bladed beta-propeller [Mariniflexile sp. KMM 9835]MDQ8210006.1 6-bladed beta-propeller [Mariniflexile sp. KMM 9835]
MKNNFYVILVFFLISCKESNDVNPLVNNNIKSIKIDLNEEAVEGNFDEYFSSSYLIQLETNEFSIISKIDRISFYNNRIYILDKKLNSVFIFSDKGKFLYKIKNIGKGPHEYISLTDFGIDEVNKQIVVYADKPYKVIVYDLLGEFIEEKKLDKLYSNIALMNGKMVLLNNETNREYMLQEYDLSTNKKNSFLESNEIDEFYSEYALETPCIIKDRNIKICLPYSDIIYEYNKNGFTAKYSLDFGRNKMPNKIYEQKVNIFDVYNYANENNYGWGISNFRETKDYITFSYLLNKLVIYSKKTKKSEVINSFYHKGLPFINYFAHDGNDNKLISKFPAESFKNEMNTCKSKYPKKWSEIPDNIKKIAEDINIDDNPLLIVYQFKNINN